MESKKNPVAALDVPDDGQLHKIKGKHYYNYRGEVHTVIEWSNIFGIRAGTIRERISRGVPADFVFYHGKLREREENDMRLIDADAFIVDQLRKARANETDWQIAYWTGVDDTLGDIADAPTIDALVLPCKVGDAVYMEIGDDETPHFVDTGKVFAIGIDESGTMWISVRYESGLKFYHTADDIGKTFFRTREEAEAALAKKDGDG